MEKKIYKYPTGATIPEGAVYLTTVTQTEQLETYTYSVSTGNSAERISRKPCWLVWHYFLVEVKVK